MNVRLANYRQVEALKGKTVVQAACGGSHTLFVTSDGHAYAAGRSEYVDSVCIGCGAAILTVDVLCGLCSHGRLGLQVVKASLVPMPVDLGVLPVRQVSAGGAHSFALLHASRPLFSPMIAPIQSDAAVPPREL